MFDSYANKNNSFRLWNEEVTRGNGQNDVNQMLENETTTTATITTTTMTATTTAVVTYNVLSYKCNLFS